ncbi:hypothetical protein [Propionibacterium sp.]|uniref:hypothetical protein n=1 Tax=Propionibacterium sp. TaxID=1977903 RepID=UPI0039E78DBF
MAGLPMKSQVTVTGRWWGDPDAAPIPEPEPDADGAVHRQPFSVTVGWQEAWNLSRRVLLADAEAVEAGRSVKDTPESDWLSYGVTFVCQLVGSLSLACGMLTDITGRVQQAISTEQPVLIPDWLAEQGAGVSSAELPSLAASYLAQRMVQDAEDHEEIASRAYGMLAIRAALVGDAREFGEIVNDQVEPEWFVPGIQDACIGVSVLCAGIGWGEELAPSKVLEAATYNWPGDRAVELLRGVEVH